MCSVNAALSRIVGAVWRPTPSSLRGFALAGIVVNCGIAVTGATVRVTGSGLGCPEWPHCTPDSLVPVADPEHDPINMAIEFGNRQLTWLVFAVAALCLIAAYRSHRSDGPLRGRRDLVLLAALQPVGVAMQGVVGGIVVLTDLHPAAVAGHFLASIAMIVAAVALWVRSGESGGPVRSVVRPELRILALVLVAVTAALIVAGTVVTGTGPHAGDIKAPRYALDIVTVTQVHADLVYVTVGLTFALWLALRLTDSPRLARRRAAELLGIELLQGGIGYAQYFLGVPAALAALHVLGAVLVWVAVLRLYFALRVREPVPEPAAPAPAARLAG
ncbi:MAG: heme A synthase [Streptosporangiales bacterium]|nr:heme A synthase [Streptosporangiales bacterium]